LSIRFRRTHREHRGVAVVKPFATVENRREKNEFRLERSYRAFCRSVDAVRRRRATSARRRQKRVQGPRECSGRFRAIIWLTSQPSSRRRPPHSGQTAGRRQKRRRGVVVVVVTAVGSCGRLETIAAARNGNLVNQTNHVRSSERCRAPAERVEGETESTRSLALRVVCVCVFLSRSIPQGRFFVAIKRGVRFGAIPGPWAVQSPYEATPGVTNANRTRDGYHHAFEPLLPSFLCIARIVFVIVDARGGVCGVQSEENRRDARFVYHADFQWRARWSFSHEWIN